LQNAARWLAVNTGAHVLTERNVNVTKAGQALIAMVRNAMANIQFDVHCATVCETDDACANFPLENLEIHALDKTIPRNMTCFKGPQTVRKPQQMCDVTREYLTTLSSAHALTIV
jgi:hypothetical protein